MLALLADFTTPNVKLLVARKLSDGLWMKRPKRDACHGGPRRIGQNLTGKQSCEVFYEEEALARRRLDRAGRRYRCRDHLSSRFRADRGISPLISIQSTAVDQRTVPFSYSRGGRIRLCSGTRRLLTHLPPGVWQAPA